MKLKDICKELREEVEGYRATAREETAKGHKVIASEYGARRALLERVLETIESSDEMKKIMVIDMAEEKVMRMPNSFPLCEVCNKPITEDYYIIDTTNPEKARHYGCRHGGN